MSTKCQIRQGATTYHICQDLQGALDHWKDSHWSRVVRDSAGNFMTPARVKKAFQQFLAEGKRVIPFGECDNFDFQKGCLGHPVLERDEGKT